MISRFNRHKLKTFYATYVLLIIAIISSLLVGCGGGSSSGESAPVSNGTIIGTAGGEVGSADNRVTLSIPAGALSADTEISVVPDSAVGNGSLVTPYVFKPAGIVFDKPVTITMNYQDSDIPQGADPAAIVLARQYNGYFWRTINNTSVDTSAKTLSAEVNGFSTYGLTLGPYSAQLDGQQVVPPTASIATGSGRFHIDTVNNLLAYEISYQNLEGSETSAHIYGPAAKGQGGAPAVYTLPLGNPKIGQWHYDQSLEADLLAGRMYIDIHTDKYTTGEIRGQIEPAGSAVSDTSLSVTINAWDITSGMNSATQTPPTVSKVTFEIEGPGINKLSRDASMSSAITETFSVAKGVARRVRALAYDSGNQLIFHSVYFLDTLQDNQTIQLTMRAAGDNTAPIFNGAASANKVTSDSSSLKWNAATDNMTAADDIQYLIYMARTTGGQDFSWPTLVTEQGDVQPTIAGLSAGKDYYVVVRAMDESGNIDTNTQEIIASTYADGSGLFVDEKTGADSSECGSTTSPCKTISRALSLTQGNEPIYVARGNYNTTNGETFPLQLKTGSRLICEEPDRYFMPVNTQCSGKCGTSFLPAGYVVRSFPVVNISGDFKKTLLTGADDAQIRNCQVNHLMNGDTSGINPNDPPYAIEDNGNSMLVEGVQATGFGGQYYAWAGIKLTGANSQLRQTKISGFSNTALLVEGNNALIQNNRFINNKTAVRNRGNSTIVTNNTFSSSPDFINSQGIVYGTQGVVDEGKDNARIANNRFQGLYAAGIATQESTNTKMLSNIFEDNGTGISISNILQEPGQILVSRNRVTKNKSGLIVFGTKANAYIIANNLTNNSMVDLNISTNVQVNASMCNAFDHTPPEVSVVGQTGCPPGGDICYTQSTPTPILPTGSCGIIAVP